MRNKKSVLLLLVIFLLLASSLYLVYVIQDGGNPLTILNLRASNDEDLALEDFQNDPFADSASVDQQVDALLADSGGADPTPTIEFTSTSPTPAEISVTTTVTPTVIVGDTNDPIPTDTPTATLTPTPVPSPPPVTELPVAGINDYFNPVWIGGGVLVLLAFLL